jgi:hypothetical protein
MEDINRGYVFVGFSSTRRRSARFNRHEDNGGILAIRAACLVTQSPWYDYRLTTCTLDTSKGKIPDGTVIRLDGRQI